MLSVCAQKYKHIQTCMIPDGGGLRGDGVRGEGGGEADRSGGRAWHADGYAAPDGLGVGGEPEGVGA